MTRLPILAAAALALTATAAGAATLASNTAGTSTSNSSIYQGQSFTVLGSGPYNFISFSYLGSDGTTRIAISNLYIFATPYTGTPGALATAGALGSATAAAGAYNFGLSLVLTAGQVYYAIPDTAFSVGGSNGNLYAGGQQYEASSSTSNFGAVAQDDANFVVTGNAVAVPELATWAMMVVGAGVVGFGLRRRRAVISFA